MGLGDRLKSWFVIEEGTASKAGKAQKTKSTPEKKTSATKSTTSNAPASTDSKGAAGKVTDKFMSILLAAMDKNNLEGFDYLEFKQALKNMESMPMDEKTRYQSAFAMAKTMNVTPEHLVKTANHYVAILQQEEQKFGQALTAQRSKQIGGREQQMGELEKGIKAKAEHIKRLTQEIEADQKSLATIKNEISGAVVKVESTKNNFIASFNSLVAHIQKDIDNMAKYLK